MLQFSFDGDSIVNYQGYCWHFRRQSQSFGRARTNLCEFDVTVLGGDIMVWTEGSYELAAGVRGSWKSRVLVRLETLRFYSKEKTAVQNFALVSVGHQIFVQLHDGCALIGSCLSGRTRPPFYFETHHVASPNCVPSHGGSPLHKKCF